MSRFRFSLAALALFVSAPSIAQVQPSADAVLLQKNLVEIRSGQRMNIVCAGHGSPTVLFEYGSGSHLLAWQKIAQPVSAITRACFYDRAGYGFSDPSPKPMTAENVTDDLHALLQSARIARPVVLVGHSLGGLYATLYTDRFPSEVAGLVLIDPSFARPAPPPWRADERKEFDRGQAEVRACADLARAGKLTEANPHDCFELSPGRTPSEIAWIMQQYLKPFRYESAMSEAENHYSTDVVTSVDDLEEERAARSFGDKPVIVLTAGTDQFGPHTTDEMKKAFDTYRRSGHDKLAARSTRGSSIVVPQATHFIQLEQPQAVIDAITKVVTELRKSLPKP
jgi:pimeloyl-ACP methyl ester carboxylesterase